MPTNFVINLIKGSYMNAFSPITSNFSFSVAPPENDTLPFLLLPYFGSIVQHNFAHFLCVVS